MGDIYHFCSQTESSSQRAISENELGETIDYYIPDDLGDDEEMPQTEIEGPESLPDARDVTYFMLCMLLIVSQVFFVYKWVFVLLFIFRAPRVELKSKGLTVQEMQKIVSQEDRSTY